MTQDISFDYYQSTCPRIDPEVKKRWVEALRSGNYIQGRHKLKTLGGSFCCLGVYCDLENIPSHVVNNPNSGQYNLTIFGEGAATSWAEIPPKWGIEFADPIEGMTFHGNETLFNLVDYPKDYAGTLFWSLPMLNDEAMFNFNQIADIIDYFL